MTEYNFVYLGTPEDSIRNEFIGNSLSNRRLFYDIDDNPYKFSWEEIYHLRETPVPDVILQIRTLAEDTLLVSYKFIFGKKIKKRHSNNFIAVVKAGMVHPGAYIPPDDSDYWMIEKDAVSEIWVDRRCTEAEENEILFNLKMYVL